MKISFDVPKALRYDDLAPNEFFVFVTDSGQFCLGVKYDNRQFFPVSAAGVLGAATNFLTSDKLIGKVTELTVKV